jgi:uncharacterized membrane protein
VKTWLWSYLAAGLALLALDAVWLFLMTSRLYRPLLGNLLAESMNLTPAALFYLIYVAGIVALAVAPSLDTGDWRIAAARGAALGFVAYATYDLTNQATLKGWPLAVTLADIAWGTVLTAVAASCGFLAATMQR